MNFPESENMSEMGMMYVKDSGVIWPVLVSLQIIFVND
jgi:hypothetical protein